jgi:hypothetical protein
VHLNLASSCRTLTALWRAHGLCADGDWHVAKEGSKPRPIQLALLICPLLACRPRCSCTLHPARPLACEALHTGCSPSFVVQKLTWSATPFAPPRYVISAMHDNHPEGGSHPDQDRPVEG